MFLAPGRPQISAQPRNQLTYFVIPNAERFASHGYSIRFSRIANDVDAKLNRGFRIGQLNLDAYVWVLNLLDRRNPINVYNSSGSPFTTNWLNTQDGETFLDTAEANGVDGETLYRLAESNPVLYSNPRLVRFGFRASF